MKLLKLLIIFLLPLFARASDTTGPGKQPWGNADGKPVYLFTLANHKGMRVTVTNFGATVVSIEVPDRKGNMADVALGFDSLAGYQSKDEPYMGAIVGRVGNRIANARFTLEGHEYHLAANNGPHSLHGGNQGFDKRVWDVKDEGPDHVTLHYLSPDGEEGYPGNLDVTVKYTVAAYGGLVIEYDVTTDKPTVQNLTNHTYFNLAGEGNGDILKQILTIDADKYTADDPALIPTGEILPVANTPFDFRTPHAIGERINKKDQQLINGKGYDHNFVLSNDGRIVIAARAVDPASGRVLEVLTDQPGIQLYTGNFLDGTLKGKGGKVYGHRSAFCLETQHYPDAPHHPNFPSIELKPGQKFHSVTVYRFSAMK